MVRRLTQTLPRLLDPDRVIGLVLEGVRDVLGLNRAYVLLYDGDGRSYRMHWLRPDGSLGIRSGTIERKTGELFQTLRERRAVVVSEIEVDERYEGRRSYSLRRLRELEVELILSLTRRDAVVGYLLLGEKRNGTLYSSEDVELLKVVADQAAVALENARLYRQRETLARDLHDCAIQSVYALKLQVEVVELLLGKDVERAIDVVRRMAETAEDVMRTLSGYARKMRDGAGEAEDDFLPRAAQLVREFERSRSVSIGFEIEDEDRLRRMPEALAHLFPILQEGVTNVIKHAEASEILIRIAAEPEWVRLSIVDDGRGIPAEVWPALDGDATKHGLRNLRDRARDLGGELEIDSAPGRGTKLTVSIPSLASAASQFARQRHARVLEDQVAERV